MRNYLSPQTWVSESSVLLQVHSDAVDVLATYCEYSSRLVCTFNSNVCDDLESEMFEEDKRVHTQVELGTSLPYTKVSKFMNLDGIWPLARELNLHSRKFTEGSSKFTML